MCAYFVQSLFLLQCYEVFVSVHRNCIPGSISFIVRRELSTPLCLLSKNKDVSCCEVKRPFASVSCLNLATSSAMDALASLTFKLVYWQASSSYSYLVTSPGTLLVRSSVQKRSLAAQLSSRQQSSQLRVSWASVAADWATFCWTVRAPQLLVKLALISLLSVLSLSL